MKNRIQQLKEIIVYFLGGIITTGINFLLLIFFIYINIPYLISNIISYFIAVILSYYFNNKYVFQKTDKKNQQLLKMIKYFSIRFLSIGVDSFLLWAMVEGLQINIYISKILVSVFLIIGTYLANKIFVFKK